MSYIILGLVLLSLIITYLWLSERFKTYNKIKKYEKKISYSILSGDENLSKELILEAVVYYFRKKALFGFFRGFDVKGISSEFKEFLEFKNRVYSKLNNMLISKGLQAVNIENSSNFEKNFIDMFNYNDKNSFKYKKMNLNIFENLINDYKSIVKKELFF